MKLWCQTCYDITEHGSIQKQEWVDVPLGISAVCNVCDLRERYSTSLKALAAEGVVLYQPAKEKPEAVRMAEITQIVTEFSIGASPVHFMARLGLGENQTIRLLNRAIKLGLVKRTARGWYEKAKV